MNIARCPGQDRINWTADDIFDVLCPICGKPIEYFKDDQRRKCPGCGAVVENPRFDNGCAAWWKTPGSAGAGASGGAPAGTAPIWGGWGAGKGGTYGGKLFWASGGPKG